MRKYSAQVDEGRVEGEVKEQEWTMRIPVTVCLSEIFSVWFKFLLLLLLLLSLKKGIKPSQSLWISGFTGGI